MQAHAVPSEMGTLRWQCFSGTACVCGGVRVCSSANPVPDGVGLADDNVGRRPKPHLHRRQAHTDVTQLAAAPMSLLTTTTCAWSAWKCARWGPHHEDRAVLLPQLHEVVVLVYRDDRQQVADERPRERACTERASGDEGLAWSMGGQACTLYQECDDICNALLGCSPSTAPANVPPHAHQLRRGSSQSQGTTHH
jgi:hypothetical protein